MRRERARIAGIALATAAAVCAAWLWIGDRSSTTAGATGYAAPSGAPAVTRLDVAPAAPRRHDRLAVTFVGRRATGVLGRERYSYRVRATSVRPASACVNGRDRVPAPRPAGYRLRATLDPARGDGGGQGWCPGRFEGTVTYGGARDRSQVVARFSFVVR